MHCESNLPYALTLHPSYCTYRHTRGHRGCGGHRLRPHCEWAGLRVWSECGVMDGRAAEQQSSGILGAIPIRHKSRALSEGALSGRREGRTRLWRG